MCAGNIKEIVGGDSTSPRRRSSSRIRSREARRERLMAVREEMYSPFRFPSPSLFVSPPRSSARKRKPTEMYKLESSSDEDMMGGDLRRIKARKHKRRSRSRSRSPPMRSPSPRRR
jgi:hypothetical protein